MRFLLLLLGWGTVAFIPSWFASHPYQQALAGLAGHLAAPRGSEIEWVDLEIFYPYDLGIFVALCLASTWVTWRKRVTALAIGIPVLMLVELLSLLVAIKALLAVMMNPNAPTAAGDEAYRLASGVIRVTGLIAAAAVWLYFLGRDRLPLGSKRWLDA